VRVRCRCLLTTLLAVLCFLQGEAATVAAFQQGPYGCSGSLLEKKARRDPFLLFKCCCLLTLLVVSCFLQGEAATVAAFQQGPYGCSGSLLEKKARRDPFAVGPPHPSRCPAMAGLLKYCSHKQYTGVVPWDASAAGGNKAAGGGGKAGESGSSGKDGLLPAGRRSSRSGIYT
jgi:hypothetical protein